MSASIRRGNTWLRPNFSYIESQNGKYDYADIAAQLAESLRNLAESELGSQTLTLQRIESVLIRIDRRLASVINLRKKGAK